MLALIGFYWVWLLVAFLIGLATAWWVWGQGGAKQGGSENERIVWPTDAAGSDAPWAAVDATTSGEETDIPAEPLVEMPMPTEPDAPPPATELEPATPADVFAARSADPDAPDDLTIINGIGPQLNTLLGSLGITRLDQIANWGPEEIERIDSHLGVFRGRIVRDDWPEQARLLIAGDIATFMERYGEQ